MKFGFFVMPAHRPSENPTLAFERDLQMVQAAEDLGYDEVWVGEHHTGGGENIPAPDLFISAAAQRTKRIRMGTGVINLPYHHPFHVAERMAFLDHLTYGRLMMGVGPGALMSDIKLFGLTGDKLRPMMQESLEIILKLFREHGPVTYEGRYWTLKEMELQVKPYQEPHMPIAVASSGRGVTVDMIARHGLLMLSGNFFGGVSGEMMCQQWEEMDKIAQAAGRPASRADWRVTTYVYVAETTRRAISEIDEGLKRQMLEYFFKLGSSRSRFEDYAGQPVDAITAEQFMRKGNWIVGDPEECIRQLEALHQATGGFGVLLNVAGEWASRENWLKSMELFARTVMPHFRGSTRSLQRSHQRLVDDSRAGLLPNPGGAGTLPPPRE